MLDPFEIAIRAMPNGKLAELARDIDAQVAQLQDQQQKVNQELAKRGAGTKPGRSKAKSSPKTKAAKGGKRSRRGIGKERQAFIAQLVNGEPDKQWLPWELEERLSEREGTEVSRDSIRNLVREMVESGEVARHSSGNGITAASSNGAEATA